MTVKKMCKIRNKIIIIIALSSLVFVPHVQAIEIENFDTLIVKLADQEEPDNRMLAALGVGSMSSLSKRILPYLHQVLDDNNLRVRVAVVQSLGELGDKESISILESIWQTSNEKIFTNEPVYESNLLKIAIAASLWKLGEHNYSNFVFDILKSENYRDRANAAFFEGL